eukprot:4859110-Prymnesium_polylepis.1
MADTWSQGPRNPIPSIRYGLWPMVRRKAVLERYAAPRCLWHEIGTDQDCHTTFCLNPFRSSAILIQSLLASSPSKPVPHSLRIRIRQAPAGSRLMAPAGSACIIEGLGIEGTDRSIGVRDRQT